MRAALTRWVRRRVRRELDDASTRQRVPQEDFLSYIPETAEPVPALPVERSRVLTPSCSREDLRRTAGDAIAQSSFFQKLPAEIRHRILIEAFGGHTVHMDLAFDHPELPLDEAYSDGSPERLFRHGNYNRQKEKENRLEIPRHNVDSSLPKRWIWRSSDCHRNQPWENREEEERWKDTLVHASEDRCRFGGAEGFQCQIWSSERPHTCSIGAMGWLLSCRQAYCEGIDVLYGTNTIHTASKQMLLHLDKLILPQRLANIRSVELVWHFKPYPPHYSTAGPLDDLDTFYTLLAALPNIFPNLKSFYMGLHGDITPMKERNGNSGNRGYMDDAKSIEISDREILAPIDKMLQNLGPQLKDCTIALGSLEYERRRRQAIEAADTKVEQVHLGCWKERHWRRLDKQEGHLGGYWIELGHRELSLMYMCSMGEPIQDRYPPEDEVLLQPWYLMAAPRHLI